MKHLKLALGSLVVAAVVAGAVPAIAQDTAPPIAAQMYTLRNFGTLDEQLSALNRAGVSHVEAFSHEDTLDTQDATAEMKTLLDGHNISVISSHVPLAKLRTNLDSVIAEQKLLGNPVIVFPWMAEELRPTTAAGWKAFGTEIGSIADTLKEAGFKFAYHNHDFEMVEYDGKTALELLLDAAGGNVMAEVDVAWVYRAGLDPVDVLGRLQKAGHRVFAIHAKDVAAEGTGQAEDGFATVGTGVLKWDEILPAAHAAGAQWYIIEHDTPINAEDVVAAGNAYLTEKLPAILAK